MPIKERFQNPVVGDTVNLHLFVINANTPTDVFSIDKVDVYYLDPNNLSDDNPDGRRLVQTFAGSNVVHEDTGIYVLPVSLIDPLYVIGKYIDVWSITVIEGVTSTPKAQCFVVYPDLWITSPMPFVYDFSFKFQPNKLRQGAKQDLLIEIVPNVPNATDLQRYYDNLAISADLRISIEMACGNCVPAEKDLRTIIDDQPVDFRMKRFGYYKLDTTELECGIYNLWFKLDFGGNTYLSDKFQLQIFD